MTSALSFNSGARTTFLSQSSTEPLPQSVAAKVDPITTELERLEFERREHERLERGRLQQPKAGSWKAVLEAAKFISALKRILGGFVGVPDAALPDYSVARLEDLAYTKAISLRSLTPAQERLFNSIGFGQKLIDGTARRDRAPEASTRR